MTVIEQFFPHDFIGERGRYENSDVAVLEARGASHHWLDANGFYPPIP